jgi:hypothetical protein
MGTTAKFTSIFAFLNISTKCSAPSPRTDLPSGEASLNPGTDGSSMVILLSALAAAASSKKMTCLTISLQLLLMTAANHSFAGSIRPGFGVADSSASACMADAEC